MMRRHIKIDQGSIQIGEDGHFWIRDKRDNFCFDGQFETESALRIVEMLRLFIYKEHKK